MDEYIKSPLNYIGGKYKLLPQILPLFPAKINRFVDLFTGGCNVGVNVKAEEIISNDNLTYLVDLFHTIWDTSTEDILAHVENQIERFDLSLTNQEGFYQLRELYNSERNPLDLFVLVAYSFNHQIRFNNNHDYNNPFGRLRSSFNDSMKCNLIRFANKIHRSNIRFLSGDFEAFEFGILSSEDFVYCDPPYLITTGTYNDGKRGFNGWSDKEEKALLGILDNLSSNGVRFALSNVIYHKGNCNNVLQEWIQTNNYTVYEMRMDYSNSSYNTKDRDRNASREVLVTNYQAESFQQGLFDF